MSTVLDGLYYSESHEWLKVEGEFGYIGITDYAQHQLGNVVYVDLPEVDDELNQGEEFGAVESVKAASDLLSPISGTVVEINEDLEDKPELLNEDAFNNWICKVKINDSAELSNLMDAEAYKAICE
ncbi:glycine cleavage system protein GcvH [Barnesiella viscericola]|uniref:glycine cleavage system protein GcvH n=1 Tax=Barnesiella viscericola TaxID=397865 RepID=UPI0023570D08|nr:glycine cleavage system protein GcvH [Barnesiella viscericola]